MLKYSLFPPQVTSVHAQTLMPQDWSKPYTPPAPSTTAKRRLLRTTAPRIPKRHYGSDCTMCDRHLGREMAGGEVLKPKVFQATGDDRRSLLLVLDTPDFTKSVYGLVKLIRACGFTGVIVADLAVRCGGGNIDEIKPAHATACAPHLAFTYRTLMPDIVVLSGSKSTTAFLGHTITVLSNPRSWQVIYEGEDRRAVPVMCIPSAYDISKNYIYKAEAKSSLRFVTTSAWRHEEVALEGVVKVIEADPDDEEVQGLDAFLEWARAGDWVAFDTETVGKLFARDFKVVTIAFARHDSKVVWAFHPQALQDERVRAAIRKVLKSRLIGKVGQNTKYDVHACEQEFGTRPSPVIGDTRLMYKLVNAEGAADLEAIAATVGLGAHKKEAEHAVKEAAKKLRASDERERGRKAKRHEFDAMSYAYGEIDLRVLLTYCALDTFVTAVIYERLMAVMKREHKFIWSTWTTHMLPAFNAFCTIERNGLKVDLNNVRLATDFVGGKAKEIEAQIRAAGIDPEKTASIRSYFEKHGLQSPWMTEKSGLAATDAKALKKMRVIYSEHTVISDLLAWRAANKLASSYLVSLPNFIRADGRVHASFYLDGARTGRLSCVSGGALFTTHRGKVRADELVKLTGSGEPVYVPTHTGQWSRLMSAWSTGVRRTAIVRTDCGQEIRCTTDHLLRSDIGWVQAGNARGALVQVGEPEPLGKVWREEVPIQRVVSHVAARVGGVLGGEQAPDTAARAVGVGYLRGGLLVAPRHCGTGRHAQGVVRLYGALARERLRGGATHPPSLAALTAQYREHQGGRPSSSHPGGHAAAVGGLRAERVADAPAYGVRGACHREQLQSGWSEVARGEGGDAQRRRHDLRGCQDAGGHLPWPGAHSGRGQREAAPRAEEAVPVLAAGELDQLEAAAGHEIVRQEVRGLQAGVLLRSEVRSGERGGSGAAGQEGGPRAAGEDHGPDHYGVPHSGLRGGWRAGGGDRRVGAPGCVADEAERRGPVRFLPTHGSEGAARVGSQGQDRTGARRAQGAGHYFTRVSSVSDGPTEEVFDFSVAHNRSALVDGIYVHNCTDPALHQTPSHGGPDAKMVKNCFVSERGNVLVAADYKTLEVYVNAAWSNDRNMIEALESGVDFHTNTAALIGPYAWGMSPDEVRAEIAEQLSKPDGSAPKRSMAKRTTFGVLYGMGPDSLAEDINTSRLMAASMINGFFSAFPDTSERMRRAKAFVKQHGYIEVPRFDGVSPRRIRPLPYVGYADSFRHGKALRAATNTPIQGMASDVCTAAVVDLDLIFASDFGGEPKVLGSIHDSILVECPESMAMEVAKTMREVMTSIRVGPLKLAVDVEYGTAWGSLKKVKFDAAKAA